MSIKELDLGQWRVALSHDGRWIVNMSFHHIQVWRVTEIMTMTNEWGIENEVWSLALLHDGSCVVIGCGDGSIHIWNHLTNTVECQMSGHSGYVWCVAISYNGSYVVSASSNMTVQIWDCHTRTQNQVALYQHSRQVLLGISRFSLTF